MHDAENGFVATVAEMPDAIAVADRASDLDREFWAAIKASVLARHELGVEVPRPARAIRQPDGPMHWTLASSGQVTSSYSAIAFA